MNCSERDAIQFFCDGFGIGPTYQLRTDRNILSALCEIGCKYATHMQSASLVWELSQQRIKRQENRQPATCHNTLQLDPVCVILTCLFTYLQRQEDLMEWKIVRGDNNNSMSSESHAGSTRQSINESQPLFGGRMCMRECFLLGIGIIIRYDLDRTFDTTYAD